MNFKLFSNFSILGLVIIVIAIRKCLSDQSTARSLDVTVPWRPLNAYPQHNPSALPGPLISFAHFDAANKQEIVKVAHHNAHVLKKYKEVNQLQPITSYINPVQIYTQTPGPISKIPSTTGFYTQQQQNFIRHHQHQHQQHQPNLAVSASNVVQSHHPFPGKNGPPYHTKVTFLGKPELNPIHHQHQNTIHHTPSTTPKITGFHKEKNGKFHIQFHPGFGISASTTTKMIPAYSQPITQAPFTTTKAHPVMGKLQAHLAMASHNHHHKSKFINQPHKIEFSPPSQVVSSYSNFGPITPINKEQGHQFMKPSFLQNQSPLQFAFTNYHPGNQNMYRPNQQPHHQHYHHQHQHHGPPPGNPHPHPHHHQNPHSHSHSHSNEVISNFHFNQKPHSHDNHQKPQSQQLPSLPPSVITPFLEQVQVLQKETAHHQRLKQQFQPQSQESPDSSKELNSFEVINDVYAKNLVPPPQPSVNPTQVAHPYNSISSTLQPSEQPPKMKFNLKMPSPLQDASIFSYSNVGVTGVASTTSRPSSPSFIGNPEDNNSQDHFKPSSIYPTAHGLSSTQRPPNGINVFKHLNRPKDNVYKHHKQLHPSYGKKRPTFNETPEEKKPFLPTPYEPEKEESSEEERRPFGTRKPPKPEPTRSFFTIEDAMTQIPSRLSTRHPPAPTQVPIEITEVITSAPVKEYDTEFPSTVGPTLTPAPVPTATQQEEQQLTTIRTRQKIRRRRPKPQQKLQENPEQNQDEEKVERPVNQRPKLNRNRVSNYRETSSSTSTTTTTTAPAEGETTRPKTRFPPRTRLRTGFTRTPTSTSADYDSTAKASEESATISTEFDSKHISSSAESSEQEHVKHRVRLRYKNKFQLKPNQSLDIGEFHPKVKDSVDANSQLENVIIKDETDEQTTDSVTENSQNDIRSSLRLPNLKLGQKNEDLFTTLPSTSVQTQVPDSEEKTAVNKTFNRPRFSIKDYRKKSSTLLTTTITTTTTSTTPKPDSNRFNRFRFQLNKKRNETSSTEDPFDTSKRNKYLTKYQTTSTAAPQTTTEAETTITPFKRGTLPKRILPYRNHTRFTPSESESEEHGLKSMIKNTTSVTLNRPAGINLRQRINSYKNKDKESSEQVTNFIDSNKNLINLSSELLATTLPPTTSTENYKHETSIMKIAKSPSHSSTANIRSTTSNILKEIVDNTNSLVDSDLYGSPSEHSQRVAELTLSANADKNSFKSVNVNVNNGLLSRRIPNYFTISTDDPVLPIQAFFPQIKTFKDEN